VTVLGHHGLAGLVDQRLAPVNGHTIGSQAPISIRRAWASSRAYGTADMHGDGVAWR